ncbi:ribonuclease kappa [Drosophila navojoa]|uniref:ribonuclease kappa n=1 Tax=Drosophila navojoa TaxID=7232 RepID=UPI0008465397|nr:ribonuclease kappa [Drosophila navojoa]
MLCGKKCSLFCLFLSIWGTIQLLLMGMSYSLNSMGMFQTLPLKETYKSLQQFRTECDRLNRTLALRCYVSAILYALFAFCSYICFCTRKRRANMQKLKPKSKKAQLKTNRFI